MTNSNYPAPEKLQRYLSCFEAGHCHLVLAPQGKSVSYADGDQPTAAITPMVRQGVQSIAMYPVDGDFIIWAFINFYDAKAFALQVGEAFPKLGEPPVTTVQPERIAYIRNLVDLAYAAWDIRVNGRPGRTPRTASQAKLDKANERDRNLAVKATAIADGSTPSERHIFKAAAALGYTL